MSLRRLLIVEDDASIRECVVEFFGMRGFGATGVATRALAERHWAADRPVLVLLDIVLPDGSGLDLLRERRERGDRTPVILCTARGEEVQRILGLKLGADDYVVKPFSVNELWARIEAVLRRTGEPPTRVRLSEAEVDFESRSVAIDGEARRLAAKEAELLAFFLRHPGKAMSREDILRDVWGIDGANGTRTVDTHVFQLRKKVEADPDVPRHIVTVFGQGYRFDP